MKTNDINKNTDTDTDLEAIIKQKEQKEHQNAALNLLYRQLGSYSIKNESKKMLYFTQSDLLQGSDSDVKVQLLISDCDSIIVSV